MFRLRFLPFLCICFVGDSCSKNPCCWEGSLFVFFSTGVTFAAYFTLMLFSFPFFN
jgi:hypothetical protein